MKTIAFIDLEIESTKGKIVDIGGISANGSAIHTRSLSQLTSFLSKTQFIGGHNLFSHDLHYIQRELAAAGIDHTSAIDTLVLSPLLFPKQPYHALVKDDKLQTDDVNNPLNDSMKARDLFFAEVDAFNQLDETFRKILFLLLKDQMEFGAFFRYMDYSVQSLNPEVLIREQFHTHICLHANLERLIANNPVELAYCLALIHADDPFSITPRWVLRTYPEVERIIYLLRNNACLVGCRYCNDKLDIHKALKRFFGFDAYRTFEGEALQEKAVQAAVNQKSILAIFPTGGGKSITFQVPALISGETTKGLTVVISPLQSLMKDQVDNLEKHGITTAVTINGLLDPIERAEALERVENGSAHLLYISPESLRSKTIENLILSRKIARFVIDEAHCFSAWGQDFRVDYLYIGDFIRAIQEQKNLDEHIPVSCFTATAKLKVIEDIRDYFKKKLSLHLEVYRSGAGRTNLRYQVISKQGEEKYNTLRDLIDQKSCPTIVYVSRTKRAYDLAERLNKDGYLARPYHGKMDAKEKSANQRAFIDGDVPIMVATSAFGMGVDKKDVQLVIHYDISDSLENYVQEAGRAGRDETIAAECFVLYNDDDLGRHFALLNQTRLSIKEIQQVWRAIKQETRQFRQTLCSSALEIARKSGWDDNVMGMETRVTTAIAALEEAGYVKRGQNSPRIYANSILAKNAQEAIDKINASERFHDSQKITATRIIKKLLSSKSRKHATGEEAESRIDYISDHLGIVREEVIHIIQLLREENILADSKDLTAFIKKGERKNRSLQVVDEYGMLEQFLLSQIEEQEKTLNLKELNEKAELSGCLAVNPARIKTIFIFWSIKNWARNKVLYGSKSLMTAVAVQPVASLQEKMKTRHELSKFIVSYLYELSLEDAHPEAMKDEVLVEFSILGIKEAFENHFALFKTAVSTADVEDALFYLARIDALKIDGGFMVVHNRLTVERLEQDNKRRFKNEDYQKLEEFYSNKVQQIHIVGEYAQKMLDDYKGALQFVDDYFKLNYSSFLQKYFKGSRESEIKRNITPAKFRQLFGELSPAQLDIIKDNQSKHIVVAAGPGSGKTKLLVHKLASLLLMEDVKHEQLLMLTFSRASASEFKKRLIELVGNVALYVDVKTFHSYCFDILGKVGSIEKSDKIIREATERIRQGAVEVKEVTRTVLVIDEAQDMNAEEFSLIEALMEQNEDMRIIAVGDDDQNIYEFRGANAAHLVDLVKTRHATKYELVHNYRSKSNLVEFTNRFVAKIANRLKQTPIIAHDTANGKIKLARYTTGNLIPPLVQDVQDTELTGTTCVLTKTNEEALQLTGLLSSKGLNARLIQTNDSFDLYNLHELRCFFGELANLQCVTTISDDAWQIALQRLNIHFHRSTKLNLCIKLLQDFAVTNPKIRYQSDLEVFVRESKLEHLYDDSHDTILVSTIHKAKGKEFENVFLLLDNLDARQDETKRQLYVGMTRAKANLFIHTNGGFLDDIEVSGLEACSIAQAYEAPNEILIHLSYRDVHLGYFAYVQHRISDLVSGDILHTGAEGCMNTRGEQVLKFSKAFQDRLNGLKKNGFVCEQACVDFIVYWKKEDAEEEVRVILPELYFRRSEAVKV